MKKKGFTLVELMVTVAIMIIMTSTVFFNYDKFNESSILSSLAYDISLTIRQAQTYGVAARANSGGAPVSIVSALGEENMASPYGVRFEKVPAASGSPLKLFIDVGTDEDGKYTEGGNDVLLRTYNFQRGIKIRDICHTAASGGESCGKSTMDVTFKRPNPEALFVENNAGGFLPNVGSVRIELSNADETIRKSVVIYSTGQISVQ